MREAIDRASGPARYRSTSSLDLDALEPEDRALGDGHNR
jgi:hypothetical protein